MPYFSYHGGHSGRYCRHASGDLGAVVERAIALGFSHYGLSEHAPRYRREDMFDDEADLEPEDTSTMFQAYVTEAEALRAAHGDRIELLVGFETEHLPPEGWREQMRELRARNGFEYAVGSVHDVAGRCIDFTPEKTADVARSCGGREAMQLRYFDQVTELVSHLRPEIVGHIDLIRKFDGEARFNSIVMNKIESTLEAVRAVGAVLDVNARAHRRGFGPVYPLPEILTLAKGMGIGVTLGDDSHGPQDVGVGLDECLRAIGEAGYEEVHYLTRVDGAVRWKRTNLSDVAPNSD